MKALKEPLLHFLAIGVAIFALNAWREKTRSMEPSRERIEVTAAVIERLRAGYERQFGRTPDTEELRGLVRAHIREEVLCREALALGLDRDDTIVRRRMAQKMEFLTDDLTGAVAPEEERLSEFFERNAGRYARSAIVTFRHVYFSPQKHGAGVGAAVKEALSALKNGGNDETMGDPFLQGYVFDDRVESEVGAAFGPEFAKALAAQPVGSWGGPLPSSYGLHLVRIDARKEARPVKLDEVRAAVVRDFNEERRRTANNDTFERLREQYEVSVDEVALAKAAASASKTAQR